MNTLKHSFNLLIKSICNIFILLLTLFLNPFSALFLITCGFIIYKTLGIIFLISFSIILLIAFHIIDKVMNNG